MKKLPRSLMSTALMMSLSMLPAAAFALKSPAAKAGAPTVMAPAESGAAVTTPAAPAVPAKAKHKKTGFLKKLMNKTKK